LLLTLSVMDVPALKAAEPLLPTRTLMPVGVDVTLSPLRPVAVTVSVTVCGGGGGGVVPDGLIVSKVVFTTPPTVAVIVAEVVAVTKPVVIGNTALCEPWGTITLAGVDAAGLLLDRATVKPPLSGAAMDKTTAPVTLPPPVTEEGLVTRFVKIGAGGGVTTLIGVVFVIML